jgi:hypothetical protein
VALAFRREMEIKEFRVACGEFMSLSDTSRKEWEKPRRAFVPDGFPWAAEMFAVRACGRSMEPKVLDRMWCLFHPDVVGTRQHRFVLVKDRHNNGIERYTLKKYSSRKIYFSDGTWKHDEIWLLPLNPGFPPYVWKTVAFIAFVAGLSVPSHESPASDSFGTDYVPIE